MNLPMNDVPEVLADAIRGMARLQVRQEMLECVLRALIVETPPAHPLFWKALNTAQADWGLRSSRHPSGPPAPELDAYALALLNELRTACAPPASRGTDSAADT